MLAMLLLVGCDELMGPGPGVPGTAPPAWYEDDVRSTEADSREVLAAPEPPVDELIAHVTGADDVHGVIRMERVPEGEGDGVRVAAEVTGLEPGSYGLYVHYRGDCSDPGPQLDFRHHSQRAMVQDIDPVTGSLGELEADDSGAAMLRTVVPQASAWRVLGRAVVVQGSAGSQVACGVTGIAGDDAT